MCVRLVDNHAHSNKTSTVKGVFLCFVQLLLFQAELLPQAKIYFERAANPLDVRRIYVVAGDSDPCKGGTFDSEGVAEYAEVRLLSVYEVLERHHLNMVLEEQKLSMSGLINEDQVVEAGHLKGADGIVFCEVGCLGGQNTIKLKLVDCKGSVQQWNAMGIDSEIQDVLDRILGVSSSKEYEYRVNPKESSRLKVENGSCGSPVEYNGYEYGTVRIGDFCWFNENLRTEAYQNGDLISQNLSSEEWDKTTSGATAIYGEGISTCRDGSVDGNSCDSSWSLNRYGRLYNWHAVADERGLCPVGWRVPSHEEWQNLGASGSNAVYYAAESGWYLNGTNSSGFNALPGGVRATPMVDDDLGVDIFIFINAGRWGCWWSSSHGFVDGRWTEHDKAFGSQLVNLSSSLWWTKLEADKNNGFSVRCVRDAE